MNSSPPEQDAVAKAWTADLLVLGQALYRWATLPTTLCIDSVKEHSLISLEENKMKQYFVFFFGIVSKVEDSCEKFKKPISENIEGILAFFDEPVHR